MKWEIYKQLTPIEREYYDKEIVNKEPLFDLQLGTVLWFVVLQGLVLGLTAIIGIGLKRDVTALLNLVGTLQKIIFYWVMIFTLIGIIANAFNQMSQKQWLKELGYEISRRK